MFTKMKVVTLIQNVALIISLKFIKNKSLKNNQMRNPYYHNQMLCPECTDIREHGVKVIIPDHRCKLPDDKIKEYIDAFDIKVGDKVRYKPYLDTAKNNQIFEVRCEHDFIKGISLYLSNGMIISRTDLIKVH